MKRLAIILSFVCVSAFGLNFHEWLTAPAELGTDGGVTYYTMIDGEVPGGFPLAGWDFRMKLTIDSSVVDAPLTNFPVMVKISTASGIGDTNNTAVFTELGQNSLKMAMTTDDETTELFVEIEKWDGTNAWLWFKAPLIASGADTDFYLYYDNDHADNTAWVGIVGSAVATNVWNTDYQLVIHISETGSVTRVDSTIRNYDATPISYDGTEAVDGQIDGADDQDGATSYLNLASGASVINNDTVGTMSAWINPNNQTASANIFGLNDHGDPQSYVLFYQGSDEKMRFLVREAGTISLFIIGDNALPIGSWSHIAVTVGLSGNAMYVNGTNMPVTYSTGNAGTQKWASDVNQIDRWKIGAQDPIAGVTDFFNGTQDQITYRNVRATPAEIKAEYNTGNDSFITYGPEETP